MPSLSGQIVLPDRVEPGQLEYGPTVQSFRPGSVQTERYILPGFIDTHVHGGDGADTMDGAPGVRRLAKFHLAHGTTTLYPTTLTNPWKAILSALKGVREVVRAKEPGLPDIPGAHLEGPFVSSERLGAQPPFTLAISTERLRDVLALDVVRLVTTAPELARSELAAERFSKAGVRLSVGHSRASADQVQSFASAVRTAGGVLGFTHLYNAMGGLKGREPGIVGAALADSSAYSELILDGHHVHETSFLAAYRAKPKHLHLITDATRAAGLAEGEAELGGQKVIFKDGAVRLTDGTLAGSALTLDVALRNAVEAGLSLEQASRLLSANPAAYMGLADRGSLEPGKRADMVVLDGRLEVEAVYVQGQKLVSQF